MYLLDTNILSDLMRPDPSTNLESKLRQLPLETQFTSSISLGELVFGARKRGSQRLLRQLRRIRALFQVLPFDAPAAEIYGALRAKLERDGTPIGEADTRIASIALQYGFTVVTANVRHFRRVSGLAVENWLSP